MFYSKKHNILFIASPKTGSTSVELFLRKIDPDGENHKITLENRIIGSQDMRGGVVGHATAFELKNALGEKRYNNLNTFGFVRHPFDKLVSSYFFNRKGSLASPFAIKGKKKRAIRIFRMFLTFLFPKILPFQLWALFFPMKTNREYFVDEKGQIIVKYIGRTEFLNEDLKLICDKCNIDCSSIDIPHINKSAHREWNEYFKNKLFFKFMTYKFKEDLAFYQQIELRIENLKNAINNGN